MITLQHALVTKLFTNDKEEERFNDEVPFALLPDAIRAYIGERKGCHFEKSEDGQETSYYVFPKDVKRMTKESACKMDTKIVPYRKAVFGEETDIPEYERRNASLKLRSPLQYFGIKKHLVEDHIFDEYRAKWIDGTGMYDGILKDNTRDGMDISDKEARARITEIENHGVYVLAYMLNKSKGITTNQAWFDEYVKKNLDNAYPEDLSDNTYKYMKIPEQINEWISNGDWSHLNEGPIPFEEYVQLYKEVGKELVKVDYEREDFEKKQSLEARALDED